MFVTLGFNLRYHHLILCAKKLIRSGRLGHINLIRSVACGNWKAGGPVADWRKRVKFGGGVLFELCPQAILIDGGTIRHFGTTEEVLNHYHRESGNEKE